MIDISKLIGFTFCMLFLFSACSIIRIYEGAPLKVNPDEVIEIGKTTKSEVLRSLGPPSKLSRQFDGDIFIYEYIQNKGHMFELQEPLITKAKFFLYKKQHAKRDLLVILFDKIGVVVSYGFKKGT